MSDVEQQRPSVGRIVHYVSYGTPGGEFGKECRAAIMTEAVPTSTVVGLFVANPTGLFLNRMVPYDGSDEPVGGTWHWPERT